MLLLLLAVHIVSAGAVTVHAVAKCDAVGEAAAGDAAVGDVVGDAALDDAAVGDVAVDDADTGDVAVGNATVKVICCCGSVGDMLICKHSWAKVKLILLNPVNILLSINGCYFF